MKRFFLNYDLFLTGFITFIGLAGLVYIHFGIGAVTKANLMYTIPKICFLIMFILGVLLMFNTPDAKREEMYPEINILSVAFFATLSILYVLFFLRIGLITATFLFLFFSFSILAPKGVASLKSSIAYSAFLTLFIWIIFVQIFNMIMPHHLLF